MRTLYYANVSAAGNSYSTVDTTIEGRDAWLGRILAFVTDPGPGTSGLMYAQVNVSQGETW